MKLYRTLLLSLSVGLLPFGALHADPTPTIELGPDIAAGEVLPNNQ